MRQRQSGKGFLFQFSCTVYSPKSNTNVAILRKSLFLKDENNIPKNVDD